VRGRDEIGVPDFRLESYDLASAKRSDLKKFSAFFHHCLRNGVYFAPSQFETGFISTAHTAADIERTASVVHDAVNQL